MLKCHKIIVDARYRFRGWLAMIGILVSLSATAAVSHQKVELTFSEDDFELSINPKGEFEIDSKLDYIYPDAEEPGLPLIAKNIVIEGNYNYKSVTLSYNKRDLLSNVKLAPSPLPTTTEMASSSNVDIERSYDADKLYPSSNCQYVATSEWGNMRVLHFLTTPFIYNASEQKIYFIDSIKIDIELDDQTPITVQPLNDTKLSILKNIVVNPEKIHEISASYPFAQSLDLEDKIEYVVITNKELSSAFKPLCQWKTEKGIYAKVITIEDIKDNYKGKDIQLQIKNCLYDLYLNHGLKYVLLGGDDYIVPVRGCYGYLSGRRGDVIEHNLPTDMYYGCFDGCFDWDGNGNGIYGEPTDNMDYTQSVYVTRLPVIKTTDVEAFIEKLINYETNPTFNSNILMCGVNLFDSSTTSQSDAEQKGDRLYNDYIKPYWKGTRYKFYDTATDFSGNAAYEVTSENLKSQLEKGYSFIDIITHGLQTEWLMEEGKGYDVSFGKTQSNPAQTIITTMACFTNAFDSSKWGTSDPCLSESLIRNGNSGVVAYLGCSRHGIDYTNDKLGPSLIYESDFYKLLFSESTELRNFGALVAAVKASNATNSYADKHMRWLQYGLNPIGDPEMPIWISKPLTLGKTNISIEGTAVSVDNGGAICRMCMVDEWDHGEGYFNVIENTRKILLSDLPEESSLCITKPGYLPRQLKLNILQNKTITTNRSYSNDVILCGSSLKTSIRQGQLTIKSGTTRMTADRVVLGPGVKVEAGAGLIIRNK